MAKKTIAASLVPSPVSSVDSADYFTPTRSSFLNAVFPRSKALNHVVTVADHSNNWSLALCNEDVSGKRTLYAKSIAFDTLNLRDNLVELLDRADVELDCDNLVVILDKKNEKLGGSPEPTST